MELVGIEDFVLIGVVSKRLEEAMSNRNPAAVLADWMNYSAIVAMCMWKDGVFERVGMDEGDPLIRGCGKMMDESIGKIGGDLIF